MSFSYSSNIITQTGTDADLSGLSGLTGVITTQHNPSGARPFTSYRLDSNTKLHIEGDLTITPSEEMLILDANVKSGGVVRLNSASAHLRIEDSFNRNGETTYQKNCAIRFTGVDNRNRFYSATPEVGFWFKEGNFTQNGGVIFGSMSHTWQAGFGNFTIRDGLWDGNTTVGASFNIIVLHIRGALSNFDIDGWKLTTFKFEAAADPTGAILNNIEFNSASKGWSTGANLPNTAYFTLNNYRGVDMAADFSMWASKRGKFINSVDVKVRANNTSSSTSKGVVEEQYDVTLKVRDLSQNLLQGVKSYIIDQDNGNRANWTINTPNINFTNDRIYTGTTDVNGEIDEDILVAATVATGPITGLYSKDIRFVNRNVPIKFCGYEYGLGTFNFDASGYLASERHVINQFMLPDTSVTEFNTTTVNAYATIDNAAEFYDRAKLYLYDNFAGEDNTLVSRDGTSIDAGAYDVVVDATAASAFAVSGNTITIKSSRYIGDITTTGTITLSNGATVIGTRTDSTGTTKISTLTLTNLKSNTEVRVYTAGTSTEVAGVENSGTSETFDIEDNSVDVVLHALGYLNQVLEAVDTTGNVSLPITQVLDRQYNNPV